MKTRANSARSHVSMNLSNNPLQPYSSASRAWILVLVISISLIIPPAHGSTVAALTKKDEFDASKSTNECESKILDSDVPDPVRRRRKKRRNNLHDSHHLHLIFLLLIKMNLSLSLFFVVLRFNRDYNECCKTIR